MRGYASNISKTVQWNSVNTVTNGSKKFGRINGVVILSGQAQIS